MRRSFSTATRTARDSPPFSRRMSRSASGAGSRCGRGSRFRSISPVRRRCPAWSSSARTIPSSPDLLKRRISPSFPRCGTSTRRCGTSRSNPRPAMVPARRPGRSCFQFLRHTFAARVPADADAKNGPVKLKRAAHARKRSPRRKLGVREGTFSGADDRALRRILRRPERRLLARQRRLRRRLAGVSAGGGGEVSALSHVEIFVVAS
jgi:hypothetical protein